MSRAKMFLPISACLFVALAAFATAAGGPSIHNFRMSTEGVGGPGSGYKVLVHTRVRVCAAPGSVRLAFVEKKTGFDSPPTVVAVHRRSLNRHQQRRCRTYRPTWKLRNAFFGIGVYKVRVQAIDGDGKRSRITAEQIKTYD